MDRTCNKYTSLPDECVNRKVLLVKDIKPIYQIYDIYIFYILYIRLGTLPWTCTENKYTQLWYILSNHLLKLEQRRRRIAGVLVPTGDKVIDIWLIQYFSGAFLPLNWYAGKYLNFCFFFSPILSYLRLYNSPPFTITTRLWKGLKSFVHGINRIGLLLSTRVYMSVTQ